MAAQAPAGRAGGARVLVVEDEADVAGPLVLTLEHEGYAVAWAERGWQALELVREAVAGDAPFDVVLLDLGLPDLDGLDVCRQSRRAGYEGAILVVSARGSELDRVVGLDVGADDYVVKPYRLAEVQARVRALLRRTDRVRESLAAAQRHGAPEHRFGVDADDGAVLVGGVRVPMSAREADVLRLLAVRPGRAVPREELLDGVWRSGWVGSAKTLDVTVSRLRRRLADAGVPDQVHAVRGVGYRLELPEGL